MKKTLAKAKIKEQQQQWDKATKWRRATEAALGDVDLETEMEQVEDAETTTTTTDGTKTVVTMANYRRYEDSGDNGSSLLIDTSGYSQSIC